MYERFLIGILARYGIESCEIFDCQKGYRNEIWPIQTVDDKWLSVIFYKREDGIIERINRADKASEYLAEQGFPTRMRHDKRTLQIKNTESVTNVRIYNYLPGATIPWEEYTMNHIKLLGLAMGRMHVGLAEMSVEGYLSVYDEYLAIIDRMKSYFSDEHVSKAIIDKLEIRIDNKALDGFEDLLCELKLKTGQQVLHMDFVRGNVLFDGQAQPRVAGGGAAPPEPNEVSEGGADRATGPEGASGLFLDGLAISGILDFEKVAAGHPIMDIARTLAFLLVDCKYKQPAKTYKYFLQSGYKKRAEQNTIQHEECLSPLIKMFLAYDLYKFLCHNPYESLHQNEHFVRTVDILKRLGVISYIQN